MASYYHLMSGIRNPARAEEHWDAEFRRTYPCLHRPSQAAIDVVLSDLGDDAPLTLVWSAGINLARQDFLEVLEPAVSQNVSFGRVFDADGKQIEGFRTLGRKGVNLRLRGGPKSTRQFCKVCGQFLYYPMGKWYLLRSQLTGQPLYYSDDLMGIVVDSELHNQLRKRLWTKLFIRPIPVFEKPLDGLPDNLENMSPEMLEEKKERGRS